MASYSWKTIFNKQDRIFSILNIISVAATMLILIALTGLLVSFKIYSEKILDKLPKRIDVFKTKNALKEDFSKIEPEIKKIKGVKSIYKRIPTFINFIVNNEGYKIEKNFKGSTIDPREPFPIKDIHGKNISFFTKEKLNSHFDEFGIIVSFAFLKDLGYLEDEVLFTKPKSWQNKNLPEKLEIKVLEKGKEDPVILPIPIIGIAPRLKRANYLVTQDFYDVICYWKNSFYYMLKDRNNKPLVPAKVKITKAYYVLTDDQSYYLEEKDYILDSLSQSLNVRMGIEFWSDKNNYEQRLVIKGSNIDDTLNIKKLNELDKKLRKLNELKNLAKMKKIGSKLDIEKWEAHLPINKGIYTDSKASKQKSVAASIYLKHRNLIRPTLEQLRAMGLFANSPLERYLRTFEQQEKFFTMATIGMFTLILFLSGVVLFSTFYSSILRKKNEIGIFKAYGASNFLVLLLLYIQSNIIIAMGAVLGIFGGFQIGDFSGMVLSKFAHLEGEGLSFTLSNTYVVILCAIMFFVCWLAISIPARLATSVDPADVIKN